MSSYDKIIARLDKLESANDKKEVSTLRSEFKALYAEVKAIRNNYKNNNKIVTGSRTKIINKINEIKEVFNLLQQREQQGYIDYLVSNQDDYKNTLH